MNFIVWGYEVMLESLKISNTTVQWCNLGLHFTMELRRWRCNDVHFGKRLKRRNSPFWSAWSSLASGGASLNPRLRPSASWQAPLPRQRGSCLEWVARWGGDGLPNAYVPWTMRWTAPHRHLASLFCLSIRQWCLEPPPHTYWVANASGSSKSSKSDAFEFRHLFTGVRGSQD